MCGEVSAIYVQTIELEKVIVSIMSRKMQTHIPVNFMIFLNIVIIILIRENLLCIQ